MSLAKCDVPVAIGILAHNEEARIEQTLRSLFSQDVFQTRATELVIVANGCTDKTAAAAERSLVDHRAIWAAHGSARVEEIVVGGKANAWNQFVHQLSARGASILVLMDADITILNPNTISSMIATLEASTHAVICVDRPVKDIELKTSPSFLERLLLGTSPTINPENVGLCGQLYCAYSEQLRLIKLPVEIMCDDGFVRALALTEGFTKPEDPRRIVMDTTVSHSFASVATLRELFKHEKWIVAGNIVNALLFERFWAEARTDRSAMTLMREWQMQDAQWLFHYIQSQVKARKWDLLPRGNWTRRWSRLRGQPFSIILRRLPVAAIATIIDAAIFVAAIRDVRRGRAFRYWGR